MFSQDMIKGSLEASKKCPRSVNSNNNKNEIEVFNVNYENLGSFGKKTEHSSSALIPPWIRTSLGISEKNSSFGSKTESNTTKLLFKCNDNKFSDITSNLTSGKSSTPENKEEVFPFVEVNIRQVTGFTENRNDKSPEDTSSMVIHKNNMKEPENQNPSSREKKNKNVKSEVTSIDVVMALDGNMLPQKSTDDEKKRNKHHRQKIKTKKRSYDEHKSDEAVKSDLDVMLENKARELLEKYFKRDIYNLAGGESDGKSVVLNGKVKPETVKLEEKDVSLLQDIKDQIGTKENIEKILENLKTNDSKTKKKDEMKHVCEKHKNKAKDNSEKNKPGQNQQVKNEDVNKETLLSTDDENEIKKFSEFLSKNKNFEEKRKCLEEVRNFFEKKRKSRIERQVKKSEEKNPTIPPMPVKKEKDVKVQEVEKKQGNDEPDEVVEKAVSETLQKFTELYRFEIPQTVIEDMKKSIIKTINSETLGQSQNRKNLDRISLIFELKDGVENFKSSSLSVVDSQNKKICVVVDEKTALKDSKHTKKNPFKTVIDSKNEKDENESMKELMKNFEHCLESIQAQVDITGTKLSSIVFEKTDVVDPTKKAKLVYNFKKADSLRISYEKNSDGDVVHDIKLHKSNEHATKSTKTQTADDLNHVKKNLTDKTVQTKEKKTAKITTQTEWKAEKVNEEHMKMVRASDGDHVDDKPMNRKNETELMSSMLDLKNQAGPKEFSQSDKGILSKDKKNKKLDRSIKSDCFGINKPQNSKNEHKKKNVDITAVNYLFLKQDQPNTEPNLKYDPRQTKGSMDGDVIVKEEVKAIENHPGCVWLWNGKKIDPGCDLKVQVEELMKEKLKELIESNKATREAERGYRDDTGEEITSTESLLTSIESSERNLEIRKIDGKFCFSKSSSASMNRTPFVFTAESKDLGEERKQPPDKLIDKTNNEDTAKISEKEYREVGTQNSQLNFLSKLNLSKLTSRSRGKIHRHKFKNTISSNSLTSEPQPIAVAKKVSETKKVKLEIEKEATFVIDGNSTQSFSNDSNLYDSFLSNSTFSADSEDLAAVRHSMEKEDEGVVPKIKLKESESDVNKGSQENMDKEQTNLKQWEFIESVLNRVNQKEKENLWDDTRDFVKTKIGRDINDEGAREVCIEIEQDLPKHKKGKTNQTIVAKGNYTRKEGDIEVEVDLTLDDLERILRHRQKKLRRRQNQAKGFDSKQSSSSAAIASMEEIQKYQSFLNSCKALGGDYITESELRILKDSEN